MEHFFFQSWSKGNRSSNSGDYFPLVFVEQLYIVVCYTSQDAFPSVFGKQIQKLVEHL